MKQHCMGGRLYGLFAGYGGLNLKIHNLFSAKFQREFRNACPCLRRRRGRYPYRDTMYTYKYANTNTEITHTEGITMDTIHTKIESD